MQSFRLAKLGYSNCSLPIRETEVRIACDVRVTILGARFGLLFARKQIESRRPSGSVGRRSCMWRIEGRRGSGRFTTFTFHKPSPISEGTIPRCRSLRQLVRRSLPKARWAKVRETPKVVPIRANRTLSAAARKSIAAAQRARWAKVKAEKKTAYRNESRVPAASKWRSSRFFKPMRACIPAGQ